MDTQQEVLPTEATTNTLPEIQSISSPEQEVPEWKKVIEQTRETLSNLVNEQSGQRLISHVEFREARKEGDIGLEKEKNADRQRAINELVGARKGFDALGRFETYFRMKPALDQKKQEVEQVVSSIEKRIANKQFGGMSQMELGQQLEEERRLLMQVDQEISTIAPDELKDENILRKRGFWTDARRTSNQAIEQLIQVAKGEVEKPEKLTDLNLTSEEPQESVKRIMINIVPEADVQKAIDNGVSMAGRNIVMKPGGEQEKQTEVYTPPSVEDRTPGSAKNKKITKPNIFKRAARTIAMGALLFTLARSSGVGVNKPVSASTIEPAGRPAEQLPSTPFPVTPSAKEVPAPPTPQGTPSSETIKVPPSILKKEVAIPTPTLAVPPTQTSTPTFTPTSTPTKTPQPEATATPTVTATPTRERSEEAVQKENQDPLQNFLTTPIEIKGTLWESIKFPEGFITQDWVNTENNTRLSQVIKDMLSDWLRIRLAQENKNVNNLPDGMSINLNSLLTDEQKELLRKTIQTTSFDQYASEIARVYQEMILKRGG